MVRQIWQLTKDLKGVEEVSSVIAGKTEGVRAAKAEVMEKECAGRGVEKPERAQYPGTKQEQPQL